MKVLSWVKEALSYPKAMFLLLKRKSRIKKSLRINRYVKDKNIWIIGGSRGIGKALAREFIQYGGNIIISARDEEVLKESVATLSLFTKNKDSIKSVPCDVCDLDSLIEAYQFVESNFKVIDYCIFASAISKHIDAKHYDLKACKEIMDINLIGFYNVLSLVLDRFKMQKFGNLSVIGSVAGYRGLPSSLAYSPSKAALINIAESLYMELKDYNVDVKLITPGFVKTRITDKNSFKMPFIVSTEEFAKYIVPKLAISNSFEIIYPRLFVWFMKLLAKSPSFFYLRIMRLLYKLSHRV